MFYHEYSVALYFTFIHHLVIMRLKESFILLSIGILSAAVGDSSLKSLKRVKRIFNGLPVIGRNMGYGSVRYFAAVGTLHDRTFPLGLFGSETGSWSSGVIKCGGALITTRVVQTACHCLAEFEREVGFILKYVKRDPVLMNVWETAYVVYVGINEERENLAGTVGMTADNAIRTRKFVVHQSCGKLGKITQQVNTHDFGWITLDDYWWANKQIPKSGVDFAPLYDVSEFRRMYFYFFRKLPVCLHLGFGRQHDNSLPERLMHGWGVILYRPVCLKLTSSHIPVEEIDKVWTWFCSYHFPGHWQKTGHGDSGGPIACNDYYFGVVEGSSYHELFEKGEWVKHNFTVVSQLTYALFENAFEYRRDFVRLMEDYSQVLYAEIILNPTFNPYSTPQTPHLNLAHLSASSTPTRISPIYHLAVALFVRGVHLGYLCY